MKLNSLINTQYRKDIIMNFFDADVYETLNDGSFDDIKQLEEINDFIELDIDETVQVDPDESHKDMWHDFDEINPDDIPF